MSETTTQRLTSTTLNSFNKLKANIAASMSFDEFLNRLMDSYEADLVLEEKA